MLQTITDEYKAKLCNVIYSWLKPVGFPAFKVGFTSISSFAGLGDLRLKHNLLTDDAYYYRSSCRILNLNMIIKLKVRNLMERIIQNLFLNYLSFLRNVFMEFRELSDDEWGLINPLLPPKARTGSLGWTIGLFKRNLICSYNWLQMDMPIRYGSYKTTGRGLSAGRLRTYGIEYLRHL